MVYYRFQKDALSLGGHPVPLWWVQSLRSRRELEYSLTLRTLYVNAALSRRDRPFSVCSCASGSLRQCHEHRRLSPSSLFLPRSWQVRLFQNYLKDRTNNFLFLLSPSNSPQSNVVFSPIVSHGPGQVMLSHLFSTACIVIFILAVVRAICRQLTLVYAAL